MAVIIPKLEQMGAPESQSVGRIQTQGPDLNAIQKPAMSGLANVAEAAIDTSNVIKKKELEAKDIRWTEAATNFENRNKVRLEKVSQMKGDPTGVYGDFDKTYNEDYQAVLALAQDDDDRKILAAKLQKANGHISLSREMGFTKQYMTWEKEVGDNRVKLYQDRGAVAATILDAANNLGFDGVATSVSNIRSTRAQMALRNGYDIKEIKDDNGVFVGYDLSNAPAVEAQIKSDIGDMVIPMVKTLNNAGKVAEAKKIIDEYGSQLNAKDLASLKTDTNEASVTSQAYANLAKFSGGSMRMSRTQINKLDVPADVKFRMNTMSRQFEFDDNRAKTEQKTLVMQKLEAEVASGNFANVESLMQNSGVYKSNKDILSRKDLDILKSQIEKPIVSDPSAVNTLIQKVSNNESMTYLEEQELKSKIVPDLYNRIKQPDEKKRPVINYGRQYLKNSLEGVTDSDGQPIFPMTEYNKMEPSDKEAVLTMQSQFENWMGSQPVLNNELVEKEAKNIVDTYVKNNKSIKAVITRKKTTNQYFNGGASNFTTSTAIPKSEANTTPVNNSVGKVLPNTLPATNDLNSWANMARAEGVKLPLSPQGLKQALKDYRDKKLKEAGQ